MKLYLAGLIVGKFCPGTTLYNRLSPEHRAIVDGCEHLLESYHYFYTPRHLENARRVGKPIFLDSGAFSAWSKGAVIDLPKYCRFINDNSDIIGQASVLDVIGDAEGTFQNQLAMEKLGAKPLPCFHFGEDVKYLKHYIANYEYITIGGLVGQKNRRNLVAWLDYIWGDYLTDASGRPRLKVHAFGVTSVPIIQRYPWWSVDSSSWVQWAKVGSIFSPSFGAIMMSNQSSFAKQEGKHFNTFSPIERAAIMAEFDRAGFTPEQLAEVNDMRCVFNQWAYTEIGRDNNSAARVFHNNQIGLFE